MSWCLYFEGFILLDPALDYDTRTALLQLSNCASDCAPENLPQRLNGKAMPWHVLKQSFEPDWIPYKDSHYGATEKEVVETYRLWLEYLVKVVQAQGYVADGTVLWRSSVKDANGALTVTRNRITQHIAPDWKAFIKTWKAADERKDPATQKTNLHHGVTVRCEHVFRS
jgi:hypothetical protein